MPVEHRLVLMVESWLRRHQVGSGALVVAVSGGPDSVALLRVLLGLRPEKEQASLIVAHLNHQLRGAESDADEKFVGELSRKLADGTSAIRLRTERIDVVAAVGKLRRNLEATARRLRYTWLRQVAQEEGAAWVATGHTADDQAETILHRLLRGTGIRGLRGIAARRPLAPGVDLIRPLIRVSRDEVTDYLSAVGQDFRHDSSNKDDRYTRNRIRHELLPFLGRQYNSAIVAILNRLADQADETFRWLEELAQDLLRQAERPRAGQILVFDHGLLAAAPRHLVREMFRLVWEREGWPADGMGHGGWQRLAAVAQGERAGADLPGTIRVRLDGRVVQLRGRS